MPLDVVDLRNFYGQALGRVARRFVGRGIRARWQDVHGLRVLGIGYPTPYLGLFRDEAERCLAFMPAAQGVVKWPSDRPVLAALVDEDELPLPEAAVDRVLLVHAIETSQNVGALLREVWRVLAAGGRLLVVVPNRRGVWARIDTTPIAASVAGSPVSSTTRRDGGRTPARSEGAGRAADSGLTVPMISWPPSRSRSCFRCCRSRRAPWP